MYVFKYETCHDWYDRQPVSVRSWETSARLKNEVLGAFAAGRAGRHLPNGTYQFLFATADVWYAKRDGFSEKYELATGLKQRLYESFAAGRAGQQVDTKPVEPPPVPKPSKQKQKQKAVSDAE